MIRLALLTVLSVAVPLDATGTQDAVVATTTHEYAESQTLKDCLSQSADVLSASGMVAAPVRALFMDGQTKPVDMVLCVALSIDARADGPAEELTQVWYRLERAFPDFHSASIQTGGASSAVIGGEVRALLASPDGKYLAVQYSAEGHTSIEVVDLPLLLRDRAYRPIGLGIDGYPGFVSIKEWNGDALDVTSDVLLSHPAYGLAHLNLLSEEVFSWDARTGTVTPRRDALRHVVPYYAAALSAREAAVRREAAVNLGRLGDRSAGPLLERARTAETDASVQEAVLEALDGLERAAADLNGCVSGSDEVRRAENMVAAPIDTLFVDGQSQRAGALLCIVNESRDPGNRRRRRWFRLDLASPNPIGVAVQAGNGDPVESLHPSPDGRYLAIRYRRLYEESIAYVEVVDLPALMRDNQYRAIQTIHRYPASVSITGWNDGRLEVTNDGGRTTMR